MLQYNLLLLHNGSSLAYDIEQNMAKTKFITREEYQKVHSGKELTYSFESPVSSIFLPPEKAICFILQRNLVCSGARETLYAARYDRADAPLLININAYFFSFKAGEEKAEISEVKRCEYHHAPDLPAFLKNQAPHSIKIQMRQKGL